MNYKKHWFLILNIITFTIALIDCFIWRNSYGGFPIFTMFGIIIVTIISWIYEIAQMVKNKHNCIILRLIVLWFTVPFYGIIGVMSGIIVGFAIF